MRRLTLMTASAVISTIVVIILCFASSVCFSQPFTHEAHKVKYNEEGKVYFEEIYNVHNRGPEDIMDYARSFAKKIGATIVSEDEKTHTIHLRPKWTFTDASKNHKLYGIVLTPDIEISGKANRTRINISDITFEGADICGKEGTFEQIMSCKEVSKHQKVEVIVFLREGKGHVDDLMRDYKDHLVESVRNNKW